MGKLSAILWKNYLLKRAHISGFLAELLLPVAFMALLILIKSITDKYDSPNVAYFCGNSFPWFYSESLQYYGNFLSQVPIVCTQKPAQCESNHYFESGLSFNFATSNFSTAIQGYGQYGYIESAASSAISSTPFYTYTIGDTSSMYRTLQIANPSLPFCTVLSKVHRNHAIFAVAPETSSSSALVSQANSMRSYFLSQCNTAATANSTAIDYSSTIVYFDSQDDLESYITDRDYDEVGYGNGKVAFAVVLNSADVASSSWDYSVRANYTSEFDQSDPTVACLYQSSSCDFTYTIPSTKYYSQDLLKPQSARYLYGYTFSGFSTIQQTVDQYIFNQTLKSGASSSSNVEDVKIMASVSLMPTTAYQTDSFQYVISSTLGIFYMLSFLYPVSRIIRSLVLEKETRIREGMKMMGLSDTVYNLSWLITTFIQMTLVAILITLVTSSSVFEYSNKIFVFIYFEVFSLAVISMCFLLSSLFSKSKSASLLGPMIFFASFFPYYAVNDPQYSSSSKAATCILAPACFALGANVFADYEGGLVGIQSDNYTEESSNFSYSACVGMLLLDAVLYGLLAWYIDKVIPSEFGTQLPFYFPFLPSYWLGVSEAEIKSTPQSRYRGFKWLQSLKAIFSSRHSYQSVHNDEEEVTVTLTNPLQESTNRASEADGDTPASESNAQDLRYMESNSYLEPIAAELRQQLTEDSNIKCISIRNLRKEYGSSSTGGEKRIAVAGLNMDLFQGQVTVLLGHNGAGKSTTIGMLVGMIPPTSGKAIMPGGFSINEHMQAIRGNLGVCPQHDILFPELTALQHLQIYAVFKGVDSSLVNSEAQRMINEVGLKEKANAKSSTLSGGQKRKLSLGIALIGDSKVVILDEPTSGMDPYSRRSTWNIIQRNKKGRVILLTTHFMDEADLLGDRIAIMSNGKLQCMGSSMFLKNKFGVGYTLTIVKESQSKQQGDVLSSISQEIEKIVQKNIPAAEPLSNVGAEQSFRLPFSSSGQFSEMFRDLDLNKAALGIAEYGISVTTLEEVFLRVDRHDYSSEATRTQGLEPPSSSVVDFNTETEPTQVLREKSRDVYLDTSETYGLQGDEETAALTSAPGKAAIVGEDDDSNFVTFLKHFKALFQKRYIYGKRDKRMVFCQILLPFIVVVIGLSLLLIRPNTSQPNLVLSPVKYNPKMDMPLRNFVAFGVEENAQSPVGAEMERMFTGQQDEGVYGVAVPIGGSLEGVSDSFGGCSEGANVLYNMSQFLMQPQPDSEKGSSRYGAITIAGNTNLSNLNYNVMVNGSAIHGVGIYVNQVHQAFLQVLANSSQAGITARNYPLPSTFKQQTQTATVSAFIVALFCMIACCFIPASFAVFIVKEREVKAKHQQIISGVSIYSYWCSSYAWDIVSYLPTALLIYLAMLAYQVKAYTEGSGAGATIALFLLFGPSSAAMTYLLSFLFVSHSTAQVVVMFFNFITGLCLMVTSFVLTTIPTTTELNLTLRYFFRLFPAFCLGDGLIQLALCDGEICPSIDKTGYNAFVTESPLSWDTSGADIAFMAIESVLYFLLALLIEYLLTFPSFLSFLYYVIDPPYSFDPTKEDEDVVAERTRVLSGQAANDVVRIEELRKVYPANSRTGGVSIYSIFNAIIDSAKRLVCGSDAVIRTQNPDDFKNTKVAVQSLCFGVPKGECFGFLGINGAGKTTTLSILSGEFPPSSGRAFIDGFNILESQSNIRKRIGYCPQFESLLDLLTVREHLELYARIKGVTAEHLEKIVMDKMDQLDLRDFENKVAGSLSGGNKRKLTVAVATIGGPSIVFLDEPSTGMDPMSRRFMWKVIAKMSTQDARCSVILTTHSMEEAEALCTRIGVMVNGRLCCVGSGQHLKHRFGNGYEVNIKATTVDLSQCQPLLMKLARIVLNYEYGQITDAIRNNNSLTSLLNDHSVQFSQSPGGMVAASEAESLWERLALVLLSRDDVRALCTLLYYEANEATEGKDQSAQESGNGGGKNCFELIRSGQSGALVDDILNADGCVPLRIFLEWFISEEVSDSIHAYMQKEFPAKHKFLERSSLITFRFRIFPYEIGDDSAGSGTVEASNSVLADVFSKFESSKERLRIQEYSVGQTTLEQIFNQFAAGQDNPEVVA